MNLTIRRLKRCLLFCTLTCVASLLFAADAPPGASPDPLYSDELITIYPLGTWCYKDFKNYRPEEGLAVVYTMEHAEQEKAFQEKYGDFAKTVIQPLLKEHNCLESVKAWFFRDGELDTWWKLEQYLYKDVVPYTGEKAFTMANRWLGEAAFRAEAIRNAPRRERMVKANKWLNGREACEGPFCEFEGGLYLNAIYAGDVKMIQYLDAQIDNAVKKYMAPFVSLANRLKQRGANPPPFSMLPILVDTYLYDYKDSFALQCNDDLVSTTRRWRNSTYQLYDQYGIYYGQGGGEVYSATYLLKPEFLSLCNKLCDHLGGGASEWLIRSVGHQGARRTFIGLREFQRKYRCDSEEVLTFEKNLIDLTQSYMADKTNWLSEVNN